ncbi:MAG: signal recognition particle protein [Gammaproteobacteria bacterium]|nr:signal recognition particle protein [Gammaproteobacteria bacterium]MCP5201194.1 signal recognition particle protein [Gammaproteobacteria bacterium]
MFQNLTQRLGEVVKNLSGRARLTEENIDETLREVRVALLEADVGLDVIKDFLAAVRERALGQEVIGTLTPGQAFIRVVRDELTALMGNANSALDLAAQPPVVVLMAGLQGSGKTTTAAKLARRLMTAERKQVGVVSCDVHRPAAIEQLRVLAAEIGANHYPSDTSQRVEDIAAAALAAARRAQDDVLIVDTAGRLAIDAEMMDEIKRLHAAVNPHETLFVIDSMMGQDAVATARAFNEALPLTGVVLTKSDGDARGGAALSVRRVTGKPIKFLGTGEKTDALEPFHPDRMASRILGMGDVLSLIEEVEQKVDQDKALKVAEKLKKGKGFDLQDFRDQLDQMANMGGMQALLGKLPGMSGLPDNVKSQVNDGELKRLGAIIDSMTPHERQFPAVIKASRKRRIAAGSGTQVQDVNRLLKQFDQMQKMMKKLSKKGALKNMMRGMRGQMPPGFPMQ